MAKSSVAIIGGGLMGAGIAQVFAAAGHPVALYEPDAETRGSVRRRIAEGLAQIGEDSAAADGVILTSNLADAVGKADYVTEAAPEKLPLKQAIFAELVDKARRDAILASNTSVIPIGRIAHDLPTAERIVGTHWWNPAPLVPLVEVVQAAQTSPATVEWTMALLSSIGKAPAHVRKDVPGFIANRLQHALWREAIAMVAEGLCDAATLDACVKNSFGLRLPVLGPLENADLVGLDLTLDIHRTIIPELDRHEGPHEYLIEQVAQGRLGFKSGRGFSEWSPDRQAELRNRLFRHLAAARQGAMMDGKAEGPGEVP